MLLFGLETFLCWKGVVFGKCVKDRRDHLTSHAFMDTCWLILVRLNS